MNVTAYVLNVAASTVLAGAVWAQNPSQNPSSSQTPQTLPGQPSGPPGSVRTPGTFPSDTIEGQAQQPVMDPRASARGFVKEAAEGSATEVALGKLAQEKGSSDAVKQFGKRMVDDHSKATEELKQAAAMAQIEVPSETPKKARKAQDKLSKLSGADFDRAYTKMMVSDHKGDVKAFEREARNGAVPAVKNFAAKTLPTLQEHLKLAEELYASVGKGSEVSNR
jgi:putative membrane protein